VLGSIYLDVHASNQGETAGAKSASIDMGSSGSAVAISKSNALDYVMYCAQILDEQNIPSANRWLVVPAWMRTHLLTSDLRDASITGDGTSVLRNGRMGMIDRFTIYHSNLLSSVSDTGLKFRVLYGHKSALGYASQITKTEAFRSHDDFADLVRGLLVCGWKVLKPDAIGLLYCNRA
jgi:hypothetical protein